MWFILRFFKCYYLWKFFPFIGVILGKKINTLFSKDLEKVKSEGFIVNMMYIWVGIVAIFKNMEIRMFRLIKYSKINKKLWYHFYSI